MAYQAWVTNAQSVLRRRRQEQVREQAQQLPVGESGWVQVRVRVRGGGAAGMPGADQHPMPRRRTRGGVSRGPRGRGGRCVGPGG